MFWFHLAGYLGKTVGELQETMTMAEFSAWLEFDKINPITDLKRIYRPAALQACAFGGNFEEKLEFLHPSKKAPARQLRPVQVIRAKKE